MWSSVYTASQILLPDPTSLCRSVVGSITGISSTVIIFWMEDISALWDDSTDEGETLSEENWDDGSTNHFFQSLRLLNLSPCSNSNGIGYSIVSGNFMAKYTKFSEMKVTWTSTIVEECMVCSISLSSVVRLLTCKILTQNTWSAQRFWSSLTKIPTQTQRYYCCLDLRMCSIKIERNGAFWVHDRWESKGSLTRQHPVH